MKEWYMEIFLVTPYEMVNGFNKSKKGLISCFVMQIQQLKNKMNVDNVMSAFFFYRKNREE
jgi:hypothetical protein